MQDYRPEHLIGDLDHLITEECRKKLDAIFQKTMQEYKMELSMEEDERGLMKKTGDLLMARYMAALGKENFVPRAKCEIGGLDCSKPAASGKKAKAAQAQAEKARRHVLHSSITIFSYVICASRRRAFIFLFCCSRMLFSVVRCALRRWVTSTTSAG